ncbi:MAG: hypothetical protein ABA06_00635 [Parcubacteria bacterium C7867-001]|nr:MAG: hypothetical protein ABA06_00635 [Parcubacteria bacterium C7867-001]
MSLGPNISIDSSLHLAPHGRDEPLHPDHARQVYEGCLAYLKEIGNTQIISVRNIQVRVFRFKQEAPRVDATVEIYGPAGAGTFSVSVRGGSFEHFYKELLASTWPCARVHAAMLIESGQMLTAYANSRDAKVAA